MNDIYYKNIILKKDYYKKCKPILKWVGGKTQIMEDIISKFPEQMDNYYELFIGGGSVLIELLKKIKEKKIKINKKIYAFDINNHLINLYKHIQNNKVELYKEVISLKEQYNSLKDSNENSLKDSNEDSLKDSKNYINRNPKNLEEGMVCKESFYYYIRNEYNKIEENSIKKSAYFLFLNKVCFRGIYRVGKNNRFNVPYGHYSNTPNIIDKVNLYSLSKLFKDVIFECQDCMNVFERISEKDFVYLDPPYYPINKSFVGYSLSFENEDFHKLFFEKVRELKCKFVMSNSNSQDVYDIFSKYIIYEVIAKRSINSKKPQSKTTELIIQNY